MSRNLLSTIGMVLVTAAVLAFGATNVSAELIQNGSFETSDLQPLPSKTRVKINEGDTANLPHWFIVASSVEADDLYYFYVGEGGSDPMPAAHDGAYYITVEHPWSSGTLESVSQDFAVTAGMQYDASFWTRDWNTTGAIAADVTFNLGSASGTTSVVTGIDTVWTEYAFSFIPTDTTTATLTFTPATLGNHGLCLDSVSVVEIPEPGTLALLATGLIGLLCYAWRKRK